MRLKVLDISLALCYNKTMQTSQDREAAITLLCVQLGWDPCGRLDRVSAAILVDEEGQ